MKILIGILFGFVLTLSSSAFANPPIRILHPQLGELTVQDYFERAIAKLKASPSAVERDDLAADFEERIRKIASIVKVGEAEKNELESLLENFHTQVRKFESDRRMDQTWAKAFSERFSHFLRGAIRLTLGLTTQAISTVVVGAASLYVITGLEFHPSVEFDLYLATAATAPIAGYIIKRGIGSKVSNWRIHPRNALSYRLGCREVLRAFWKR